MMEKCIIVAIADNNAIGRDNALLWHISEDLKFFKAKTSGCPVIMGRKTFESIGRPLPGRTNIVISRGFTPPEGVLPAGSLENGLEMAAAAENNEKQACFIIGGGQIYAQAMDLADRLIVTHVHTVITDADTFFPEIDPDIWQIAERSGIHHDSQSGLDYEFVEYLRYR